MSADPGYTVEPTNLVERACAAAMDAADTVLADAGATTSRLYIALVANGLPAGDEDACAAAHGEDLADDELERAFDVVTFLVSEARQAGAMIGLDIRVVPVQGFGQG